MSQHRRAVVHRQHHVADVLQRLQAPQAAHVVELAALRIEPAAGIAVVGRQRALHLQHRQADAGDLGRIEQHLVLHGAAAKARIIRHAGNGFVCGLDDPVLEGLELHRRPVGALQHVAIDQTRRRGQRRHRRRHAARQTEAGQPVENFLAGEVVVGAIVEREDDVGQSIERDRALRGHLRNAVHPDFDGHRDQPFHFLGGVSGPLGDDLDHRRRKIGIGIHRQAIQRPRPRADQHERQEDDEKALPQRRGDDPVHDRSRSRRGSGWKQWSLIGFA